MTKVEQYLDDISDIKNIMNRSSKFLSLSGLSGILAGLYALCGAIFAYFTVFRDHPYQEYKVIILTERNMFMIFYIATAVIMFSLISGVFLSYRKAKKQGRSLWDAQARQFIMSFLIPLVTGGVICLLLIDKGFIGIIPQLTLVFYGLALVNASHHTYKETKWLGISEIILGILSFFQIGYSLFYWGLGFGVLHIIYGIVMYFKYER